MEKGFHIYCQIPFCHTKCPFCCYIKNFLEHEIRSLSMIPEYIRALINEIDVSKVSSEPLLSIVLEEVLRQY